MNKEEVEKTKIEVARKKHQDSIKYKYFSRYLMIRYVVTIFFFTNLMWLIISASYGSVVGMILALAMGIYSAVGSCLVNGSNLPLHCKAQLEN